jgi:Tfp pilus assembly protein PilN
MTTFTEAPSAPRRTTQAVNSSRVDWAPVPKVNLLPREILQTRRLTGLKRGLAGAVAGVVLLCGGATVWAQAGVSTAQDDLDAAQAEGAALRTEQARYAGVPKLLNLIQAAGTARERAMSKDVLWYGFLSDLSVTTPKGVTLNSLQASMDDKAATTKDPLVPAGLGTVTFTGTAEHVPDVAAWLDAVAHIHGLDGSALQSVTREDAGGGKQGTLSFTSTVSVTSKALTHRYDRKAD